MPPESPYPRRPLRLKNRAQSLEPFYFVTLNTFKRASLLGNDGFHRGFLDFCNKAMAFNVAVGRYAIMPDHMHLFVRMPPEGMTLSRWIGSLKSVLGRNLLAAGHSRPHWQEGFFDHLMRSSESYGEKWRYVQQNPVRARLCANPEDWPFQGEIVPLRF